MDSRGLVQYLKYDRIIERKKSETKEELKQRHMLCEAGINLFLLLLYDLGQGQIDLRSTAKN